MLTLKPRPTQHVGAQALLQSNPVHCGWLRRRKKFLNKFRGVPWMKFFVVLHGGSFYCFWDERAKAPWAAFSIYGFNRVVRAADIPTSEAPWCFKLEHIDPKVSNKYFSASSPNDMKDWMLVIKSEMTRVNKKHESVSLEQSDDGLYSDIEEPIYQSTDDVDKELYDSFEEDSGEELIYPEPSENYVEVVADTEDHLSTDVSSTTPVQSPGAEARKPDDPTTPSPDAGSLTPTTPGTPETDRRDNKKKGVGKFLKGIPGRIKALKKNKGGKSESSPEMRLKGVDSHRRSDVCCSDQSSDSQQSSDLCSDVTASQATQEESTSYWEKIWFNSDDPLQAFKLISDLEEEGVFIVRRHELVTAGDGPTDSTPYVLIVHAEGHTRKYKIHRDSETEELFISRMHRFQAVEDLLYHYYSHTLPNTTESTLTEPYYLHVSPSS